MKIDWFYLKLFLRLDVMFTYLKRWWQFGERPPKETMLVSDRPLTKEESEYGASLEPEALRILRAVEHGVQRTELCSGVGHSVYESILNPGHCHVCGKPLSR